MQNLETSNEEAVNTLVRKEQTKNILRPMKRRTRTNLESMKEFGSRQRQADTKPLHPGIKRT